jgi:hypothetical protein
MSRKADLARLERLESYIDDIFTIVDRHGSNAGAWIRAVYS